MKTIKFGIKKSGAWYWVPQVCPHKGSYATFRFDGLEPTGEERYKVQFGWMAHFIQIFWLRWIIYIDLAHDTSSFGRPKEYVLKKEVKVTYEDTKLNN